MLKKNRGETSSGKLLVTKKRESFVNIKKSYEEVLDKVYKMQTNPLVERGAIRLKSVFYLKKMMAIF